MMDITQIKAGLENSVESVVQHLLPNGVKQCSEWRVGSLDGGRGQSLGVHLTGAKRGVWADFNGGVSGDIVDLWAAVRCCTLSEALIEAADWLGIEKPKPVREPKRTYVTPPRPQCQIPKGRVRDYLVEERNIPEEIIAKYKIGEQGDLIFFPFLLPNGDLALVKTRQAVAGGKPKPTAKDCQPVLFGWQAIPDDAREIVLCEGEIDCLSWAAYDFHAMSVPFGGGKGAKQQWIENDFERMARFEKIYLATDMDKGGDEAAEEIASRLGRHRCYRVVMPYKDGNECLVNGVKREVMAEAIRNAVSLDPDGLRRASDFTDAVVHLFWPAAEMHEGYRTPYGKLGDKLLFRPGELSLWSGASGAGKSQILSDCAVDWVKQSARVCLSSLEMRGAQSLKRMCKQVTGIERPTAQAIGNSLIWLDQGLLVYEFVGKASISVLLEVFDYARQKYGCDMFIIDSLMRLGIAGDDYTGQEKAVFNLVDWTISRSVHSHLVAHARKGNATGAPETEDVKGAMEIGANAANILTVWRNRSLEDEIRKMELANDIDGAEEKKKSTPGVIFNVAKQRNGDFEGKVGLWFDQQTYRYYSSYDKSMWSRNYIG